MNHICSYHGEIDNKENTRSSEMNGQIDVYNGEYPVAVANDFRTSPKKQIAMGVPTTVTFNSSFVNQRLDGCHLREMVNVPLNAAIVGPIYPDPLVPPPNFTSQDYVYMNLVHGFVVEEDEYPHYDQLDIIGYCMSCDNSIYDGQRATRLPDGDQYHQECFKCADCAKSLIEEGAYIMNGRILCSRCSCSQDYKTCAGCHSRLFGSDHVYIVGTEESLIFHEECYKCHECGRDLDEVLKQIEIVNGNVYCRPYCRRSRLLMLQFGKLGGEGVNLLVEEVNDCELDAILDESRFEMDCEHIKQEDPSNSQESGNNLFYNRRRRTRFTENQLSWLRRYFSHTKHPNTKEIEHIANSIDLSRRIVTVWFQNARAAAKRTGS
ncbi:hypothetical protein ACOME3_007142 [Neoechinorhynchus agilis]